jgi:K+ transporter
MRILREHPPMRIPGTAVFLTADASKGVPLSLTHHVKHVSIRPRPRVGEHSGVHRF